MCRQQPPVDPGVQLGGEVPVKMPPHPTYTQLPRTRGEGAGA